MPIAKTLFESVLWRGLVYISTFVLNILIARHFEAAISGNIYYFINLFSLVHLVTGLSLESGIIYFGAKKEINPTALFNFAILWTLATTLIVWLLLKTFITEAYSNLGAGELRIYALCFVCGTMLYNYCAALFYAQKNFRVPNLVSLFVNLFLIAMLPYGGDSLFAGITDDTYFYYYFVAFVLQGLVTAIAYVSHSRQKLNLQPLGKSSLQLLFQYSLLAWLGNLLFFLLYRVDYWFVERYCSAQALGNYIQVSKFGNLFFLLPTMVATAILPLAATEDKQRMARWLAIISRFFLFFYALVCLLLVFVGHRLFPLIFGETFDKMYTAFLWLIPGILSLSTLFTLTAFNAGKNRLKANMLGCVYALAVVIAGNALLVPSFGINAAAATSSAGYIVYQVYLLIDFKKENGAAILPFFIFRFDDAKALLKLVTSSKNPDGIQQ